MKQNYALMTCSRAYNNVWNLISQNSKLNISSLFLLFLTLFGFSDAFGQFPGNDNTPGVGKTFTVPANVTHVNAAAWGAGGGGGGSNNNGTGGNGGGGGGAASSQIAVNSGNVFTYTLTAGGAAGGAGGGAGGNGGNTTITAVTPAINMIANGGTGGLGNAVALNTPTNSGGGTASGGTTNSTGSNGIRGGASGGAGGNSGTAFTVFGTGGLGNTNNAGSPGGQPGAGGGGGERNGGTNSAGGAGAPGRVMFDFISVSSVSPSPVCVGSTITITGTNFSTSGTTTVTVNGTACTSVTVVNTTTITAVIGAGTTSGVVDINNNGRRNNGRSITVNPLPAAIAGGAATVCTGSTTPAFTNATAGGTWSIVNGTGTATISAGGIVTGVSIGTATVVYTLPTTCSVSTPITIITTPTITTNPTSVSIAAGANTSFTVAGSNLPTSYTWQVSTNGGSTWTTITNGGVYSNATTATLNITAATFSMDGYLYRASATNACGTSSYSANATLTVTLSYCTPTGNLNCTLNDFIANVTYNTLNNTTTCNAGGYTNFPATGTQTTTVVKSFTYNLSLTVGAGTGTHGAGVWIDFNQNGVFTDAGEFFLVSNAIGPNSTTTIPITIPIGAVTGNLRMRVRYAWNITVTNAMSCTMAGTYGETEDYTITTIDPPACVAPTAQPTALSLTASGTIISGSFTAASPAPNSYLVVISTSATPPSAPVNGTNYSVGGTLAPGYTIVDNDTNTVFSATGLTNSTTYYIYIYSFNNLCSGGPLYLGTSPLTGNITTGLFDYCVPTSNVSSRYIEDISTAGYITNITNMGTGRAATGYADYTAVPPVTQIPGGGVTLDYRLVNSRQYVKVWVDWNNDGIFTDAAPELVYTTGGVQTIAGSAGFVIPIGTLPGNYRIRFRSFEASQTFTPCATGLATGETEDYRLVVVADCAAKITSVVDGSRCDTGTVNVTVNGSAGTTQYRFYSARTGGTLVGTSATTTWTTPSIATTTSYYVTAWNGTCESWYREEVKAIVNPTTTINVTPSTPEVCGENNVVSIAALGDIVIDYLVDENFEGGGFGVLTRTNVAADANTQWTNRTSPYVPTGSVWKPAITSRTIGNRFALSVSDFAAPAPKDTQLRTVALNTTPYSSLFLSFRHYFSYYVGEPLQFADIDVSTDGGGAWTNIARYTSTQGFAGEFNDVVIDVSAYTGLPSVMFRFRYHLQGSAFCDGWAIDDVKVYGTRPLNTTFTWSGGVTAFIDLACTIPYVAQSVSTVYVKPTPAQLELPTYSFTATATLGNGCPVSKLITINNLSKVWKGGTSGNWNDPNNWSPVGVPDATTCVIIPPATNNSVISGVNYNGFGKTLQVKNGGNLQILSNNTLTITDFVEVTGTGNLTLENSSSLIQVNNVANTGNITMKRNVNLRKLDYVYWSSPVANFGLTNISTTSYRYKWIPTIPSNINGFGNWSATSETMVNGKGYIVRGPDSYTSTPQNYTANFVGVPNNGTITTPISRGTYNGANYSTGVSTTLATRDDDNWNLIGNPYPSAVNANLFLAANTNIAGFIKYWTHGTLPSSAISDPFYNNFGQNYTVADYVTYNATGSNPAIGNGNIAAGQGFFVLMNHTSAATTENVVFNNSMRRNDYRNDLFYRNSNENNAGEGEKHRIWLNLISPSATSSPTLIGYVDGATNDLDRMYDAPALDVKTNFELYSFSNTDKLNIQGRSLPFDENDEIPLGISIAQNGNHTIGISTVDGLFESATQNMYLEDRTLGITHDLRSAPYAFTATTGRYENRFVLKFKNSTLGNEDFTANAVTVFTNESINVNATNQTIKSVRVHDLLGRVLGTFNNVNSNTFSTRNVAKTQSPLLVEVTLDNGATKTYKVIF